MIDDSGDETGNNQVDVPARIRHELGTGDERRRWQFNAGGTLRLRVVRQQTRTFADFDGYDGAETTDVATDHGAWGVGTE